MIYVQNKIKFAVSFKVEKEGVAKTFAFDCKRVYQDTGNVATTGVTPMAEDDFDWLYKNCKQFKDHVDQGLLVKTKESGATAMANKMDILEKENALLKEKLKEQTKAEALGETTATEDKSLKKQLESTKKSKKTKTEEVDESEGF